MKIYYHSKDFDGYCSGAILKKRFPNAEFIGYDYGEPFEIEVGEPVIMADVSLPMSTMLKVAQASNYQFTWIDHHASAIKDYHFLVGNGKSPIHAILQDGVSACELTWNYCFPNEPMPEAVKLLGEYDTWRNQNKDRWDNEIMPFQWGMRSISNSLETFPMDLFHASQAEIDEIIEKGRLILNYQKQQNEITCRGAFEAIIRGYRAICVNSNTFNSGLFESIYDEEKHDLMIPFAFTGKAWKLSLYTTKDDIDCSEIAKSLGGGGHKKAAGFQVEDIREVFLNV